MYRWKARGYYGMINLLDNTAVYTNKITDDTC